MTEPPTGVVIKTTRSAKGSFEATVSPRVSNHREDSPSNRLSGVSQFAGRPVPFATRRFAWRHFPQGTDFGAMTPLSRAQLKRQRKKAQRKGAGTTQVRGRDATDAPTAHLGLSLHGIAL